MSVFLSAILSVAFGRRLFVGLVAAYVGVALTLGGTRAARPTFAALALGGGALLAVGTMRAAARSRRAPAPGAGARSPRIGRVEVIAFNVALTLVLAEIGLRTFAAWGGASLVVSDTLEAHLLIPGHDYGDELRGNQLGFPGPDLTREKRPGIFRIAALGDSFALGPAVPFSECYLTLLGARLPHTEVCNFGVSGAGPREYAAVLQKFVWAYKPDLMLLSVFVGNDITETLATPRAMDPRQHSLYLLATRAWRLGREQARQAASSGAAPGQRRGACLSAESFREVERRRLAVCLRAPARGMEKKWRRALADLDRIVSRCRERGVPLAVVLIPDEFQVNPAVLELALREAGVGRAEVDLELPQRRLSAFFASRGVACLDLLPVFKRNPSTYAPRDTHWNQAGNRLAAELLAAWLKGR